MTADGNIKLDKPGAGLPFLEKAIAQYILFPYTCSRLNREKAVSATQRAGKKCIEKARYVSKDQLSQQILIPRLRGLEDSSRYWSIAMTIEHLFIVHNGMLGMTRALSADQKVDQVVSTADVKPTGKVDPEDILGRYEAVIADYADKVALLPDLKLCKATHLHPWFGELNAHQWLCLNAIHTQIHLGQILEIIKRL